MSSPSLIYIQSMVKNYFFFLLFFQFQKNRLSNFGNSSRFFEKVYFITLILTKIHWKVNWEKQIPTANDAFSKKS